jgi:multiple sugar transport system substrate-binding protein
MVAIAAGDPPDVLGLWNYNVPAFAQTNAILPIDELAAPMGVTLDTYALALRPILTHPDASGRTRMWAAINTGGTLCLYYNKRIFREEAIPAPPRTLSELIDIHRRLTRRGPDGRLERAGFLHAEPGWWTWIWGYHTGGSMWDAAAESATVAAPAFARAYEWMQDANRDLTIPALQTFQDSFGTYDSPQNAFLAGKVAMVCQGPWLSNVIKEYNPALEYGAAPFPVADELFREREPVGLVDTDILVIPQGVKNPEASMEFVAYTQRPEVVEFLSLRHHKIYPLATPPPPESFYRDHPNAGIAAHQLVANSPRGFLAPRTRTWPQLKAEFDAAHNTIRRLEAPAPDILARVEARMNGVLERNADQRQRRGGPPRGRMPVAAGQDRNPTGSKVSKGQERLALDSSRPSSR